MLTQTIDRFVGKYDFLSNFYPHLVLVDCYVWPTTEHYYQAMKTVVLAQRDLIRYASTPGEAKNLGRKCTLRDNWEDIKIPVMARALEAKFQPGSELAQKLLHTEDAELIEGNTWHDNFWGYCVCEVCANKPHRNELGTQLMNLRTILRVGVGW